MSKTPRTEATATATRRRALLPSVAGAGALALFAALVTNDLVTGARSDVLLWLAVTSLVAVPLAFLAGLLRSRLARGGLTDLFRELRMMRGPALQGALAKTLGDPELVVAYRIPGQDAYVRSDGAPVTMPQPGEHRRIVPVEHNGREIAALVYDASLDDDPELVEAVSAAAAIALENEHCRPSPSPASRSCAPRASASSPRATPSAAASSATSTTARSSGSSRSRCS